MLDEQVRERIKESINKGTIRRKFLPWRWTKSVIRMYWSRRILSRDKNLMSGVGTTYLVLKIVKWGGSKTHDWFPTCESAGFKSSTTLMTSLVLSGPASSGRNTLVGALESLEGYGKHWRSASHDPLGDRSARSSVGFDVRRIETIETLMDNHCRVGRPILLATVLTKEQLEPLQKEFLRYKVRVKYLESVSDPHALDYRMLAYEWAKTWFATFPLSGKFVVDEKVRERVKESKNLFSVLEWSESDDKEKIFCPGFGRRVSSCCAGAGGL